MRVLFCVLCLSFFATSFVNAEDSEPAPATQAEEVSNTPPSESDTFQRKLELAQQMHVIRPARAQVDNAISQVARQIPIQQRDGFINAMRNILNYQALEKISIDAMVETYTLAELEAMVEYHSKPEAKSAAEKYENYSNLVLPEIKRMIDRAIMQVRTGSPR